MRTKKERMEAAQWAVQELKDRIDPMTVDPVEMTDIQKEAWEAAIDSLWGELLNEFEETVFEYITTYEESLEDDK